MKKFIATILLSFILLSSCSPIVAPSTVPILENTATPWLTFTPSPVPTLTSTPIPFINVAKRPLFTFNAMTKVPSPDSTTGIWVVGDNGFIAYQSSLGSTQLIDSPEPRNLYNVDFVSPNDGWIVGAGGLIMHWNGKDWEVSKSAEGGSSDPYSYDLYTLDFIESNDGWAAGGISSEGGCQFLIYHWDGSTWAEISLPEDWNLLGCVHDMAVLSPTDVWITGTNHNVPGTERGVTIHWDGSNWTMISLLSSYNIYSLSALSPDNIWAITNNGTALNWNGVEWKETAQLDSANLIFAQDPDDIFAVGTKIWYWNGSAWADISSSSNLPLDAKIKSFMAPYKAESGYFNLWMLDASGIIYTFEHPRTIRR